MHNKMYALRLILFDYLFKQSNYARIVKYYIYNLFNHLVFVKVKFN